MDDTKKTEIMAHLNHVDYPATKENLVEACEKMSDIPEADKKWFTENLPNRTYNSAMEVEEALRASMPSASV